MDLPVIFRKLGNGEIIALFPGIPGKLRDTSVLAYTAVAKRTEVDKSIMRVSTEATPQEREALLIEVVKAFPHDQLIIRKRITEDLDVQRSKARSVEQITAAA